MTGRIVHFQLSASSSAIYKSSSPPHVSVPNQLERSEHIYRYIYRYKYIYKYESKTNTNILIIYQIQILIQQFQRAASCVTSILCKQYRSKNLISRQRYNNRNSHKAKCCFFLLQKSCPRAVNPRSLAADQINLFTSIGVF